MLATQVFKATKLARGELQRWLKLDSFSQASVLEWQALPNRSQSFAFQVVILSSIKGITTNTIKSLIPLLNMGLAAFTTNQGIVWDRFADHYSKQAIADVDAYQEKLQRTRAYLQPQFDIVEVGCGTGGTSRAHAPWVRHVLGTDISNNMIAICNQRKQEEQVKNVDFSVGTTETLNIPNGSKQVVLTLNVLHLVPNRSQELATMRSWLSPGGVLVTSTPCIGDMGWPVRVAMGAVRGLSWMGVVPTVYLFTRRQHVQELKQAGFDVVEEWQPKPGAAVFCVAKKK